MLRGGLSTAGTRDWRFSSCRCNAASAVIPSEMQIPQGRPARRWTPAGPCCDHRPTSLSQRWCAAAECLNHRYRRTLPREPNLAAARVRTPKVDHEQQQCSALATSRASRFLRRSSLHTRCLQQHLWSARFGPVSDLGAAALSRCAEGATGSRFTSLRSQRSPGIRLPRRALTFVATGLLLHSCSSGRRRVWFRSGRRLICSPQSLRFHREC
jgi:hypothetical protein